MRQLFSIFLFVLLPVLPAMAQWDFVRVDEGTKPALTLGPGCVAEVSYMLERDVGYVRHAQIAPGAMPAVSEVDTGYFYGPLDVASSLAGDVFISYHDHDIENQIVASRLEDAWDLEPIADPGHDGWDNSILVTESGIVHSSSVDPSGFGGRGVEHARRSMTGTWNVEPAGTPSIMYANATSIAIGANREPAIAYYNDQSGDLELAERVGGIWRTSIVDSTGDTGRFPSMVVDEAGDMHIAYYRHLEDRTGIINYTKRSGGWTFAAIDTLYDVALGFTGARRNVALALDPSGQLHLVYGDRSVVKYTYGSPDSWKFETVVNEAASPTVLGQQVDLALCKDDDLPHIVYYEAGTVNDVGDVIYGRLLFPVGIESPAAERPEGIAVYPNPVSGAVNIRIVGALSKQGAPLTLSVHDILGREVYSQTMSAGIRPEASFSVASLAAGTYMVQVQAGRRFQKSSFVVTR